MTAHHWAVGDRVVWPHQEGAGSNRHDMASGGTVIAVDLPGLPPGAQVEFDQPIAGGPTCYAGHDELIPGGTQ
jgi:hypothetical protein